MRRATFTPIRLLLAMYLSVLCVLVLLRAGRCAFSVPSLGLVTAQSARSMLPDSAFLLDPALGRTKRTADFVARTAGVADFPALGATDTQGQVNDVRIFAGKAFATHFHPRGTETINVVQGRVRVSFRFESGGRVVSNVVKEGQSTIIPQGLIHTSVCVSDKDCRFIANFNTADAGTVAVAQPVVP